MGRISLGSFLLLVAAIGLAAGCASTTTWRLNPFNRNKPTEGCVDVGAGPVCEGPMMGGDRLPADSGFMLPGDGTIMPGTTIMPGAGTTTTGPVFQGGTGAPPNTNFMPPASNPPSGQPGRLVPQTPLKPMPNFPQQ